MRLSDKSILNLKPKAERYAVKEDGGHGNGHLAICVTPNGNKSWQYLYTFGGQDRRMTLGTYAAMSVADAHKAVGAAKQRRARGIDPGAVLVQAHVAARAASTVAELVAEFVDKYAKQKKRSWQEDERILQRDVVPAWKHLKGDAVTRADVRNLLDKIMRRGAPIAANRTLAVVRKMFNWAVSQDLLPNNLSIDVSAPAAESQRDRWLSESEIVAVLAALPSAPVSEAIRLALRFQLLTAQRCGDVLGVQWADVDESAAVWTIPSAKAKNGKSHRAPLSPQALAVSADARKLGDAVHVFPLIRGDKPMVETAVARAVHRNLAHFKAEPFTPHELRRTAASHMTSNKIDRLVVSKLLNHTEMGVTVKVHDRASYDSDKKGAVVLQSAPRVAQRITRFSSCVPSTATASASSFA